MMPTQNLTRHAEFGISGASDSLFLKGIYQDYLKNADGSVSWKSKWRSNLVVESCNTLLAALLKREAGISGILYWALGTGENEWDNLMPSPKSSDTQLQTELARKALDLTQIVYLDATGVPTETPSPRLQITVTFTHNELGSEGAIILREFGLFGGDATTEADSGMMIDYVIHPQITLNPGMSLTRSIHLTFGGGAQAADGISRLGRLLPVDSIDGIGRRFSTALNRTGVNTLTDLLRRDPLLPVVGISGVKLREFRAKARLVLDFRADLTPFMSLAQTSLSDLLKSNPTELAAGVGRSEISVENVTRLQEALALLQVALDDRVLQEMTLGTLSNT